MSSIINERQLASRLLMVRPANFGFNQQTSESNQFQIHEGETTLRISQLALSEFDSMVGVLRNNGLEIDVYNDTPLPVRPDAVFPNNWISFHENGKLILYPMMAENRRWERRKDIVEDIAGRYQIDEVIDLSFFEKQGQFLEGTGSMVLDRRLSKIYACLSPRTDKQVLAQFAELMDYELLYFGAEDENGVPVYHTNVIMSLGETIAVVCLEAVSDELEKVLIQQSLTKSGRIIVEITFEQVRQFAGNILFVKNTRGEELVILSESAFTSLTESQRHILNNQMRMVTVNLPTIETYGGGSARCMIAEQFLPVRE